MNKFLMITAASLFMVSGAVAQTSTTTTTTTPDVKAQTGEDDSSMMNEFFGEDSAMFRDGDAMRSNDEIMKNYGEMAQARKDEYATKCADVKYTDNSSLKEFCGLISSK